MFLSCRSSDRALADIIGGELLEKTECFQNLRELTLDGSHLVAVNLAGRSKMLKILGKRLECLRFVGNTPKGIFEVIEELCPNLRRLRLDRSNEGVDYSHMPFLEDMRLERSMHLPTAFSYESLRLFSFSYYHYFGVDRIERLITNLAMQLKRPLEGLDLEIPGVFVNETLCFCAEHLRDLQSLTIRSSHSDGVISPGTIQSLAQACPNLRQLKMKGKSTSPIIFSPSALQELGFVHKLDELFLVLNDKHLDNIERLLSSSSFPLKVIMWERRRWVSAHIWRNAQLKLADIQCRYPRTTLSVVAI
jgi:hypothetical protein